MLLLMGEETGEGGFPLACVDALSWFLRSLPSLSPFTTSATPSQEEQKTQSPLPWATGPGSLVVHHRKDRVHTQCLPFIHN